jgi:hypothetical protein
MCCTCQAGDDYAKGYAIGEEDSGLFEGMNECILFGCCWFVNWFIGSLVNWLLVILKIVQRITTKIVVAVDVDVDVDVVLDRNYQLPTTNSHSTTWGKSKE